MNTKQKFKTNPPPIDERRYKGKYGFIEFPNPNYYIDGGDEFLLRKPSPDERKEIMLNYIIDHSGEPFLLISFLKNFVFQLEL